MLLLSSANLMIYSLIFNHSHFPAKPGLTDWPFSFLPAVVLNVCILSRWMKTFYIFRNTVSQYLPAFCFTPVSTIVQHLIQSVLSLCAVCPNSPSHPFLIIRLTHWFQSQQFYQLCIFPCFHLIMLFLFCPTFPQSPLSSARSHCHILEKSCLSVFMWILYWLKCADTMSFLHTADPAITAKWCPGLFDSPFCCLIETVIII